MNDRQIRPALIQSIRSRDPSVAIFEELPIYRGEGRADVAAVNGAMYGYEIKGSTDTTARLEKQVGDYERIFDYCFVVVAENHLKKVRDIIPRNWGVMVAREDSPERISIEQVRQATRNRHTDPEAVFRLMWRQEAIRALRNCGCPVGSNTLISSVWDIIAKTMPPKTIASAVREALKARGGCVYPAL